MTIFVLLLQLVAVIVEECYCYGSLWSSCQETAAMCGVTLDTARKFLPKFPVASLLPQPLRRDESGRFVYATGAWEEAVEKSNNVSSARGVKRKFQPVQWKELRADYCSQLQVLHIPEVAEPTKNFFWDRCHLRVFAGDAGGGGDCCFLSIAAILLLAYQSVPVAVESLGVPVDFSSLNTVKNSRHVVGRALRQVVGRHLRKMQAKKFLDFVVTNVMNEHTAVWFDQWSMLRLLKQFSKLSFLSGVNEVVDVSVSGKDLQIRFKLGDNPLIRSKRIVSGVTVLEELQEEVAVQFETCGNRHWATDVDIAALSEELNLSFVIAQNSWTNLPDTAEDTSGGNVLHDYVGLRENPSLWICLYNLDQRHFQVLIVEQDGACHSWYEPDALPDRLRAIVTDRR